MRRPFQIKGRKGWHAEYRFADGQVQRRTFDNFDDANGWLEQQKTNDAEQGPLFGGPERITLGQFLGEYAARFSVAKNGWRSEINRINHYVAAAGLPPLKVQVDEHGRRKVTLQVQSPALPGAFATHREHRLHLREETYAWIAKLARKPVSKVTTDDIRVLMTTGKREGWGDSTIQKEVALLKAAFNSAINEWRWVGFRNPCVGLRLGKSNTRFVVMTQAQLTRLVKALSECDNPQFWPLVDVAIHSTLRLGSLLSLKWSQIDLETRRARVCAKGRWNDALLPARVVEILQRMPRNGSDHVFTMTENAVNMAWDGVREKAELPGMTFRDLRHVGATAYAKAGVGVHALRDLLGHTTTRMAEVYVNLANSDVLAALDAADKEISSLTPLPPTQHANGMVKHPRARRKPTTSNVFHVRAVQGKLALVQPAQGDAASDVASPDSSAQQRKA